jgi:group I intron endonuclease
MTSGVYGMKHRTTGKWYIGVSKNIEHRIKVHIYDLLTWPEISQFAKDVKKYGLLIDWVILEECSPSEFHEKEKQWVRAFDSKNNGYNQQDGGGHHRDWK